jgi:hypothetical protein
LPRRPSRTARPGAVAVRQDAELGVELPAILIDHGVEGRAIGRQPDVHEVCAEHRQPRDQPGLRGGEINLAADEHVERGAGGLQRVGRLRQGTIGHQPGGRDQGGAERQAYEEAQGKDDPHLHPPVPADE